MEVGAGVAVGVEAGLAVWEAALEDSAAAHLVGEARVEVGNKLRHLRSLGTLNLTGAMCLLFVEVDPNRAPIGVFIGFGIALAIVLVVLFFAVPVSGEDYRSGGTNYYSGPFGGFGGYGGFGGFGL